MSFTNIVENTDYLNVSIINECIKGINERILICYGSAGYIPEVIEGTDIQNVYFWRGLQDTIVNLMTLFYPADVDYTGRSDFDPILEQPIPPPSYTVRELFEAANLPNGFRRSTTWDAYGGADWTNPSDAMFIQTVTWDTNLNEISEGDIIGPWLLTDLQWLLAKMTRTKLSQVFPNYYPCDGAGWEQVIASRDIHDCGSWAAAEENWWDNERPDVPLRCIPSYQSKVNLGWQKNIEEVPPQEYIFGTIVKSVAGARCTNSEMGGGISQNVSYYEWWEQSADGYDPDGVSPGIRHAWHLEETVVGNTTAPLDFRGGALIGDIDNNPYDGTTPCPSEAVRDTESHITLNYLMAFADWQFIYK